MYTHSEYCNPDVARKVAYEFAMFQYVSGYLRLPFEESADAFLPGEMRWRDAVEGTGNEKLATSAMLESFLLHARTLRDFFYKDRPRDGDVLASHFLENWKVLRPPPGQYMISESHRLDKALAHLTIPRVSNDLRTRKWDVNLIAKEIAGLIDLFQSRLPEERRAWFDYEI
jgi:hypothetical protein